MTRLFFFSLLCFFISCAQQQSDNAQATGAYPEEAAAKNTQDISHASSDMDRSATSNSTTATTPPEFNLEKGSKIIKNGNMSFEVNELPQAKQKLDKLLGSFNSYYENEQFNAYGNRQTYSLLIRIPNSKFDSLINALESGMGKLTTKNIQAQDVTEEYVDLKIRLDNNLAYLKQYNEILKKANSIKEILEVQEMIRRIEEEIESKKGRLKFLDDKVNYSSLHLELTELVPTNFSNQPGFGIRVKNAFTSGIQGFLNFLVGLVHIWPFLVLIVLLWLFRGRIVGVLRGKGSQ
jgi:Domain of unknown function (DUF4349)